MRKAFIASIVLGLIGLCPMAAMADHHYSYRGSGGGYGGGYYRGGDRHSSHFDFSLGLGFIFGGGSRYYCDDSPRYYAPARTYYYDDAPVYYSAPVVVERPAVVYAPPPVVYESAPVVVYRSYSDSGYYYPQSYTYVQTRYYYGR